MASIFHPSHPLYVVRPIRGHEIPWMLRTNIWTGVLGALFANFMTTGVFFTAYCLSMGMDERTFGLLATLSSPMVLVTLLARSVERHFGHRKYPFFVLGMSARLLLAPMLLGFIMRVPPWAIVAMIVGYGALANLSAPLWCDVSAG